MSVPTGARLASAAQPRAGSGAPSVPVGRWAALDRVRGLAVAAMVVDHLVVVTGGPGELRWTVGRLAVPLFFLLAGHLAGSLRWRHLEVAALGCLLPFVVPWIDSPNVLLLWALGCLALAAARLAGVRPVVVLVVCLTVAVNGWAVAVGTGYPFALLLAFMAAGAMLDRSAFAWGERLPSFLAWLGRYPVSIYVGHLLVLEGLRGAF